jgi:thiamine pyrophosphokinase
MPAKGVDVRAVVVANGDPSDADAGYAREADLVIAADGGAAWLDRIGVRPNLLVGDLDSVPVELCDRLAAQGVEIERHPTDKDATDAELALARAVAAGADSVVVLGALGGGRLDHELANLLLLTDPAYHEGPPDVRVVRGATTARAVHGGGRLALDGQVGDLVTLLPVAGDARGVRSQGLRYPLDASDLRMGRSRGLSNEVVALPAWVSLEHGTLLVVETANERDNR